MIHDTLGAAMRANLAVIRWEPVAVAAAFAFVVFLLVR